MQRAGLDALVVCGNQYAGFEGAVLYVSGFEIVHRYVYAVLPLDGEPTLVFPREARWIGDKVKPWVKDHVWPDVPGQWISSRARERGWKRVGVYGMNFIMAVRDYKELVIAPFEMVPFDFEFDMARAIKSEEELADAWIGEQRAGTSRQRSRGRGVVEVGAQSADGVVGKELLVGHVR